jgi:hypothetical protein
MAPPPLDLIQRLAQLLLARRMSLSPVSPRDRTARIPASDTAFATSSMKKYMSINDVVPVRIISAAASIVPQ